MPRPTKAIIHVEALRKNLQRVKSMRPDESFYAVVKANAYGHGIEHVMEGLRGADGFAIMELMDAQLLRDKGWRGAICLIEGTFEPRDLELCSRLELTHVIHCDEQIDWLAQHKTNWPHDVFLKMNSGMNRLGFAPERYRAAWARLSHLPQVRSVGLMMHFSDADSPEGVERQLKVFHEVTKDLPGERSLCNSAACMAHPQVLNDWNRVGIALYGASFDYPAHTHEHWGLEPVMTLQSALIGIQDIHAGDVVGYGSTFKAEHDMRIGVVACGYADGYPRIVPTGTPVLVDGVRVRTVGRVSMEMLTVDLTAVPAAHLGSVVTLWGQAPNGNILSVDEVALQAHTIGYELLTALAPRVPVEVVDSAF
ncbi:MAG: alanine racemase [Saezia sp.]